MGIGDANVAGNVHGDVIMYLCDEAPGIAALRHSGRRAATAAMDPHELPIRAGGSDW
jgi:acyl-CoA hydrolase